MDYQEELRDALEDISFGILSFDMMQSTSNQQTSVTSSNKRSLDFCFSITTLENIHLVISVSTHGYYIQSHSADISSDADKHYFDSLVALLQSTSELFRQRFQQKLFDALKDEQHRQQQEEDESNRP
jgi:hypothetical protein